MKIVKSEYWTCGCDEHYHKTKKVAQKCIEKQESPKRVRPSENDYKIRNLSIARMVLGGSTYSYTGEQFSLTNERIRGILFKILRQVSHSQFNPKPNLKTCCSATLSNVRQNNEYWLGQIDKLAAYWEIK